MKLMLLASNQMNEPDEDTEAYQLLKSKLNNLFQIKPEAATKKFVTRYYNNEEVPVTSNIRARQIEKEDKEVMDSDKFAPFLNQTPMEEGKGISTTKISLLAVGIIIIAVILFTCCCTLYLRNRLMALVHRITRRKTKDSTLLPVDVEKGKGETRNGFSSSLKKLHKSDSKMPRQDVTHTVTQSVMTTTSSVQQEPSSTTCCKCFKKKRKKSRKKRKR